MRVIDKPPKIEIKTIKDVDRHMNNIVNDMDVDGVRISCRKFDPNSPAAFRFPLCAHYVKDFTQLDESRKEVLRQINEQWKLNLDLKHIDIEANESKQQHNDIKEDQPVAIGVRGGAGTGKSHLLDFLSGMIAKDKKLMKRYFLMSMTFNDALKIQECDAALIGAKEYSGVVLLRFLFIYYVILEPLDSTKSVSFEQTKQAFRNFSILLTSVDYNYKLLLYNISNAFRKAGRQMFFILDDFSGINHKEVIDTIKDVSGPVVFSACDREAAAVFQVNTKQIIIILSQLAY